MLFCDQISNFEDFNSRFGYKTGIDGRFLVNANGVRQRKNNIVYLYWKEHAIWLKKHEHYSLKDSYRAAIKLETSKEVFEDMLRVVFNKTPKHACPVVSFGDFLIKNEGMCIDGDINSIRYENTKTHKIYKMKIGKYVNKYLEFLRDAGHLCRIFWINNPTLVIFFIEELTELWKNKRLKEQSMKVVVDKDFHKIYDPEQRVSDASNFGSCMDGDQNWNFYANNSDIYDAVSLQDEEGLVYARAILVHCFDQNDNPHTYLERIYCNKRSYKDLLFEKAKCAGIFDLYKGLEASCHDNREIYAVDTNRKISYNLYINLPLEDGDYMSYQDTFKWFYPSNSRAYNCEKSGLGNCIGLATTDETIYID